MEPDDELCLCFHVTRRKVANYLRIEKPRRVAQLSECYGAGTGCGWCRPFLERMFRAAEPSDAAADLPAAGLPTADDYAHQRSDYVRSGGGTPPAGATPIDRP
jgi:bacterioferritin-associated ferredoxin